MTISLVIPSRNRIAKLRKCLCAVAAQTIKIKEVIVVENGSRPSYQPLLLEFPKLPLRLLLEKKIGKSSARNFGLCASTGDIVAFLDDDCQPNRKWAEQMITSFKSKSRPDVVLGRSVENMQSTLMRAYELQYERWFLFLRIQKTSGRVLCGGALNSRNFAIRQAFCRRHSLVFDSRYDHFGFAEDTDFGEQAEASGAKMVYNARAVVFHEENNRFIQLLWKKFVNGRAMFLLKEKNIFHEFKKKKKGLTHKIKRVFAVTRGLTPFQKFLFLIYLYCLVTSYHLGLFFERAVSLFQK